MGRNNQGLAAAPPADFQERTAVHEIVESIKNGEAGSDIHEIEKMVKGLSEENRNEIYRAFFWFIDVPVSGMDDVA